MQNNRTEIDIELLKKFNKPGPRYTSYPTAPMFSPDFTAEDYRNEILRTNSHPDSSDVSLYFHFPFCDTLCYFCGCNMLITHDRKKIAGYNDYLKMEIDLTAPMLERSRKVVQMHWGGGSPSYLSPAEISDIASYINSKFNFDKNAEISVEIDPRGLTLEHMKAFRDCGFNRLSMGVQDFDPVVQKAINRIQPEDITRQAVDWSKQLGFKSINLDLIYGLPYQTIETFSVTVDKIIDISPDRIAVFNYAHVPWLKKHMNLIPADAIPAPDKKLMLLKMTIEKLLNAGYVYIGMDHFAKPEDELSIAQKNGTLYRNFQGYSTMAGADVYAFGISAISQFANIYAQNSKTLNEYYNKMEQGNFATHTGYAMTEDDHIRKYVINELMCNHKLDKNIASEKFNIDFNSYFAASLEKLKELEEDGLVYSDENSITITEPGKLVIRNVAMCFDAYLDKMLKEKPVFSKTV
jgi:oxygen-independent coproporphyrinogen-3 oxidase